MRLGRNRASCAHDALYTVWQQTDFRPAAEGTDGKQTHEQWQSADLRHAERWMSSCAPTGCCWTCAWMHAWVECMYRNTNTHVHTRTHTQSCTRTWTQLKTWGSDLGRSDKDLSPPTLHFYNQHECQLFCQSQAAGHNDMCVYVCPA